MELKGGMMGLKEKIKRWILLGEGILEPSSEFEKICVDFTHYLRKESQNFYFMWDDGWLRRNFENIKKTAGSDEPALLLGESGSGKEINQDSYIF